MPQGHPQFSRYIFWKTHIKEVNALSSRLSYTHFILSSWSIKRSRHAGSSFKLHCSATRRCHFGSGSRPRRSLISCRCRWTGAPQLLACGFTISKLSHSFRILNPFSWCLCLRGTSDSCIHDSPKKTSSLIQRPR